MSVCLNEFLLLEYCEVRTRIQLMAAAALLAALETCADAVEVCNDEHQVQVRRETKPKGLRCTHSQ